MNADEEDEEDEEEEDEEQGRRGRCPEVSRFFSAFLYLCLSAFICGKSFFFPLAACLTV